VVLCNQKWGEPQNHPLQASPLLVAGGKAWHLDVGPPASPASPARIGRKCDLSLLYTNGREIPPRPPSVLLRWLRPS